MGGRLTIRARAKQLGDLLGTGTWSSPVFGTGAKTTADYKVGKDASGNPTVKRSASVSPAAGIWSVAGSRPCKDHAEERQTPTTRKGGSSPP